jgi:hypothetical protein
VVSGDEPVKLKRGDFTVCLSRRFPPDEGPGSEETITVGTLLQARLNGAEGKASRGVGRSCGAYVCLSAGSSRTCTRSGSRTSPRSS